MSTREYFLRDQSRTLFPLETSRTLVTHFEQELQSFIAHQVLDPQGGAAFLPQQRCYAAKHGFFLRRTVKLDPVAEYYLYDVVYRNRRDFYPDNRPTRISYGYRFVGDAPESPNRAYARFRQDSWVGGFQYRHSIRTDIASYFNSVYHHDLVSCVRAVGWPEADVNGLGRFLREINSGRSIDCLPQGIHPSKVLGSEFLRFLDDSHQLKSELILRFQDDIHLFDQDMGRLQTDLLTLQALLGERGLSLNTAKTHVDGHEGGGIEDEVDQIRRDLLQKRGEV
ncbi:MAG: RNA-directed DNA polymerase, partial [Actinomycetota bacterium]